MRFLFPHIFALNVLALSACQDSTKQREKVDAPKTEAKVESGSGTAGAAEVSGPVEIEGLDSLAAKPGDVVGVHGKNFKLGLAVVLDDATVPLDVKSSVLAAFVMPPTTTLGLTTIGFVVDGKTVGTTSLVADSAGDGLPIMLVDPAVVCTGISFRDAKGKVMEGKRLCHEVAAPPACSADGAKDCVAVAQFPAADKTAFSAADLRSGVTVAGVAGALGNCASDGAQGCLSNAAYRSAKMAAFTGSDIRRGVTVAGVLGVLDNCAADGAVNCIVDGTTYEAQRSHKPLAILPQANTVFIGEDLVVTGSGGTAPYTLSVASGPCAVAGRSLVRGVGVTGSCVVRITDAAAAVSEATVAVKNPVVEMGDLALWLKADDVDGAGNNNTALTNGGTITSWFDHSPSHTNAVSYRGWSQTLDPLLIKDNGFGSPIIRFGSTGNDALELVGANLTGHLTIVFVAAERGTYPTSSNLGALISNNLLGTCLQRSGMTVWLVNGYVHTTSPMAGLDISPYPATSDCSGGSGGLNWVNGVADGYYPPSQLVVGSSRTNVMPVPSTTSGVTLVGGIEHGPAGLIDLAEIAVFKRQLTDAEREHIERYMARRWRLSN